MHETDNLLYTQTHEWVRVKKGKNIVVGISDYGQAILSEATGVELPEPDDHLSDAGEELGVIESLRTCMSYHAPVAGKITSVNTELLSTPELINHDPYGEGWIFEMQIQNIRDLDNLLDQDEYDATIPDDEEE